LEGESEQGVRAEKRKKEEVGVRSEVEGMVEEESERKCEKAESNDQAELELGALEDDDEDERVEAPQEERKSST